MNTEVKLIKTKLGLLNLSEQLGNVSQACKIFGFSRDGFYRFKERDENCAPEALQEISRKKIIIKNRVEEAVVKIALAYPADGQVRASIELRKKGIFIIFENRLII